MEEKNIITAKKIATEIMNLTDSQEKMRTEEHLDDFLRNNQESSNLIERLTNSERVNALGAKVRERNKERDIEAMIAHLNTLKVKKQNKINFYITSGAIAAALLIASFLLFNETTEKPIEQIAQSETIERPLLIRESGEKLIVEVKDKKITAAELNDSTTLKNEVTRNKLIIPAKNQFTIILSDGTEVTLNAQSELEYPSKFTGDCREVRIKGEAYFKVTKSATPFVVKVGEGEVKVYGTSFNIKERGNRNIETILASGSVGIKYQGGNEIMIKPNQRIVINAKEYTIENVDVSNYTGWLTNSFQYYNTQARTVIEEIENWYGIKIINSHEKIGEHEKISFNISRDYSITKIISLLEGALGITIIKEGGNTYEIR